MLSLYQGEKVILITRLGVDAQTDLYKQTSKITLIFHEFPIDFPVTVPQFIASNPSHFFLSHPHNLSFLFKKVYVLFGLTVSSGLNFLYKTLMCM